MIGFVINLAAGVALLLWSVRLVRTGVERAFLPRVRLALQKLSHGRVQAAAGGTAAAMLMQSSTAVTLIVSGFIASGAIVPTAALALVIGAELGSAVMARVLFLPIQAAIPVLLLVGVAASFHGRSQTTQQGGRIVIGLALVLVSLGMIRAATAPIAGNEIVLSIAAYLQGDLLSACLLGGLLAWAMYSSLAAVLTVAALAASGVAGWPVAVALMLGANLGGALIPMTLLSGAPHPVRVVLAANLLARSGLALAGLAAMALGNITVPMPAAGPGQAVVVLHILFSGVLAILALPVLGPLLWLGHRLVRRSPDPAQEEISALDPAALSDPRLALACAQRELMRMAETVQVMLGLVKGLFHGWNPETAARITRHERSVDRMHYEVKLYVSRLRAANLSEAQARKCLEVVTVANGLEEAADRIAVNLLAGAAKMDRNAISFSQDGLADLEGFHDLVVANAQLALGVLTTGNPDDARQLVTQKDEIRRIEQQLQERHLQRLQDRRSDSVASTNMHQEVLRLLKQVNASFSYVAYPIIEEAGELLDSRLSRRA